MKPQTPMLTADPSPGFRAAMTRGVDVPEDEWAYFARRLGRRRVARHEHLLREGEPTDRVHYIVRGLVRIYWTVDGGETNLGFDMERRFVTAFDSFLTGRPARCSIETLEDCELLWFDRALLHALYERHVAWERVGRLQAEHHYRRKIDKEYRIRTRTAEQRYRQLLDDGSYLVDRVPQYHLASYLGITPETLSRIRGRLR